jgi:hypothetical protein
MYQQVRTKIASAFLILALCLALSACTSAEGAGGLVISEIVSSNRSSLVDDALGSPDWVEFYNGSNTAINLKGYGFSDNLRNLHKFVFGDVTIPARGYLVLMLSNADGAEDPNVPIAGFGLSKSGESLFLTDPFFGLVQEMTLPALETDISYARRADGSYGFALNTTPNAPAKTVVDALSDIYDLPESSLIISEVMPYPDKGDAWVELYNASAAPIRLESFFLSDNTAAPKRFELPSGTLEPGGYLVCYLSGSSKKHAEDGSVTANFRIGTGETSIYLADAGGTIVDSLTWPETLYRGLCVLAGERYSTEATPGGENSARTMVEPNRPLEDGTGDITISEVQPNNRYTLTDQDGARGEWVELYNRSSQNVSLEGYFLSDEAAAPFLYALSDQMLAPGDYVVVFLSGKNKVQDGEIHASFGLSTDETALYLSNETTFVRETFDFPANAPEDISIGRAADGSTVYYAFPTPWYENAAAFDQLEEAYRKIADVTINEVFANAPFADDTPDWIELKNNTGEEISLSGWYLSDSLSDLKRWKIPELTIPPAGFVVINATNEAVDAKTASASFSIAASGETICLSDPNGCRVDSFETGAIRAGNSAGREQGAKGARVFFETPTPGRENATSSATGYAPKPVFSVITMQHTEPFLLNIRCSDPAAAIYYTTDGAEPTQESTRYTEPIQIGQNTVIRAASFQAGRLRSDIETHTFLFDAKRELPILCLSSDPGNFQGKDGIMANKNLFNDAWERPVTIEFDAEEGSFSADCGFRLHGNMGRLVNGYGKPSMKLSFRASYNSTALNYPLFEDGKVTVFHDLLVRNGSDMRFAVIRDELFTNIAYRVSDSLCVMTGRYAAVYFNAQYMGLYAIKESIGSGYFAEHFGVSEDSVEMHRPGREESRDFLALMSYAKKYDLREEEHYRYMEERVDFSSMIDWLIFEAYSANRDLANNVRYYRSMEGDGKWHYALYDLDLSMNADAGFDALLKGAWNIIPRKLLKNESFQDLFLTRLAYLMEHELSQEAVLAEFDYLVSQIDEEMLLERARWPKDLNKDWEGYLADLKKQILKDRAAQMKASIAKYLGMSLAEVEAYFGKS